MGNSQPITDGHHTIVDKYGHKKFNGNFIKNKKHGYGEEYYDRNGKFGDRYKFTGKFINNLYHGHGTLYYNDYDNDKQYEGMFARGKRNGYGVTYTQNLRDTILYIGNYSNDMQHGYGTENYPDGEKQYVGEFAEGVYSGKGIEYHPSGKVINEGTFADGVLVDGVSYQGDVNNPFKVTIANGNVVIEADSAVNSTEQQSSAPGGPSINDSSNSADVGEVLLIKYLFCHIKIEFIHSI